MTIHVVGVSNTHPYYEPDTGPRQNPGHTLAFPSTSTDGERKNGEITLPDRKLQTQHSGRVTMSDFLSPRTTAITVTIVS